ncbi:MAG: endonuclease domain-containing protein [Bacteroidales bacterium]|nr:endonuclease domain-containing protein [Bacteroidales bacterium]
MKQPVKYKRNLKPFARKLRKNSTPGEIILWDKVLSARKFHGFQFNRQFPLGSFIVDFICRKLNLIIEVDGYSHNFKYEEDLRREEFLKGLGYNILRFDELEVRMDLDNVIRVLEGYFEEHEGKSLLVLPA